MEAGEVREADEAREEMEQKSFFRTPSSSPSPSPHFPHSPPIFTPGRATGFFQKEGTDHPKGSTVNLMRKLK